MIEYFCYVSRNKVDQLYEQLNPEADYELTEVRKVTVHGLSLAVPRSVGCGSISGTR